MDDGAAEAARSTRSLYRLGAAGGLAAVAIAIVQVAIEVVGVAFAGIPVPTTVEGWFGLLQREPLLGLTELTGLQVPMFAFLVPMFLALHTALRRTDAALSLIATAFALLGTGVYLASNTAFSMLSLSAKWAALPEGPERAGLVAAGEAMLAEYEGPGLDAGVVLVMAGTFGFSWLMRRTPLFGPAPAIIGAIAGVIGLGYYVGVAFPSTRIFLLEAAAPFFLLWAFLVSRALLREARRGDAEVTPSLTLGAVSSRP
jgi:hypothetical protein